MIERPVSDVWQFYAVNHVRNHPRWDPHMEMEQLSEGPMGLGTLIRRRNSRSGTPVEGTMEIVEFETERSVKALIHDGPVEMHGFAEFDAKDRNRTQLTIGADIPGLDESNAPFTAEMLQRAADRIKSFVETETPRRD